MICGDVTPADVRTVAEEHPDLLPQWCCMDAAELGPAECICWEPVYDRPQTDVLAAGPMPIQARPCHDCAYRVGSPEHDGGQLPTGDVPFLCHDGMRRIVGWTHPDPDAKVCVITWVDGYKPPRNDATSWRADGQPASMCAGWAASRAAGRQVDVGRFVPRIKIPDRNTDRRTAP